MAALIAGPILLTLIFRVNALYTFISIGVGYLLQLALSDDVDLALAAIIKGSNSIVFAQFILLITPIVLTMFVLKKTASRTFLLQIVPLLLSGLLLAALSLSLLPPAIEQAIYDLPYGSSIRGAQDLVIAAAAISNLLLMWSLFKHPTEHRKHH